MQRVRNQHYIVTPLVSFGARCTIQIEECELHCVCPESVAGTSQKNLRDIAEGVEHLVRTQMRKNCRRRSARPPTHFEYPQTPRESQAGFDLQASLGRNSS